MAGKKSRLEMYKKRSGALGVEDRRKMLAVQRRDAREERRTAAFTAHRGLEDEEKASGSRSTKFEEWKKRKEMEKKAASPSKPAFVIKKISYNDSYLYKPPESHSFQPPKGLKAMKKLPVDCHLQVRTRLQHKASANAIKEALSNFVFEPTSSCTTVKTENFEKEETATEQSGHLEETHSQSAEYFRTLHDNAVTKLQDLCSKWKNLTEIPSNIHDKVDVAVGYAELLIAQKLLQFQNLITEHENASSSSELKVLTTDLEGFWDLVCRQVDDVCSKFNELENMKANDWQEAREICSPKLLPKLQKSKVVKPKRTATSGLRSFLAQARLAKTGDNENSNPLPNLLEETASLPKHLSPAVMRVALKAKQIGSPKVVTPSVANARSPLRPLNLSGRSTKTTPLSKTSTPVPLRRSTRISKKII